MKLLLDEASLCRLTDWRRHGRCADHAFSVSQTDFTALHPSPETKVKISSSFDIGSGLNQLSMQVGSQLSEHSQKISNNLNDLTNKIINGGK